MHIDNQFYLNENLSLKKFLHENPMYYKYINRNPLYIKELEKTMRERYKITLPDKLNRFKDKLDMLNTFIDILN